EARFASRGEPGDPGVAPVASLPPLTLLPFPSLLFLAALVSALLKGNCEKKKIPVTKTPSGRRVD
ncbi:hypothetical protein AKJ57_06895, partial [candidate division MSBL1 archaeon SCGC-AAA259A05]